MIKKWKVQRHGKETTQGEATNDGSRDMMSTVHLISSIQSRSDLNGSVTVRHVITRGVPFLRVIG